jgi:hypothetical protein
MDMSFDRPSRFLMWAQETFGDVALDPRERVLRFLEEAVELAQAMGVSMDTTDALVARTYRREPGDPVREMGQALATRRPHPQFVTYGAGACVERACKQRRT